MSIIKKFQSTYQQLMEQKPLTTILFIALIVRLIAAFFAKGYGMHDDHYLVIEASQSWVDGTDFDNWLPKSQVNPQPEGHSFFYVGIHYLLFLLIKFLGITNPDTKMIIIRVIHAIFSLLVVSAGYKIALKYSNQRNANLVGLLLAVFWFMPFLAVRNLVEIVTIPLLMWGLYFVIDAPDRTKPKKWFFYRRFNTWSGLLCAFSNVAFCWRCWACVVIHPKVHGNASFWDWRIAVHFFNTGSS